MKKNPSSTVRAWQRQCGLGPERTAIVAHGQSAILGLEALAQRPSRLAHDGLESQSERYGIRPMPGRPLNLLFNELANTKAHAGVIGYYDEARALTRIRIEVGSEKLLE